MSILADLFRTFFRIGIFTFGGGYAMISIIEDICVEKKKWITHDEMMNMTIIAESTPGPIAINCATFVGYKHGGIPGSILSTCGVVLPSFIIIFLISTVLDQFLDIPLVAHAFAGIKIGVGLLILSVGISMVQKMKKTRLSRVISACAFCAMLVINICALNISTIALMLIAGSVSLLLFITRKGGGAV